MIYVHFAGSKKTYIFRKINLKKKNNWELTVYVQGYLGMVGRFRCDDPHFCDCRSDWPPLSAEIISLCLLHLVPEIRGHKVGLIFNKNVYLWATIWYWDVNDHIYIYIFLYFYINWHCCIYGPKFLHCFHVCCVNLEIIWGAQIILPHLVFYPNLSHIYPKYHCLASLGSAMLTTAPANLP